MKQAHLDITHYSSLTKDVELKIQEAANRIVMKNVNIRKTLEMKDEAEKAFGFSLYQGGVVPGNSLRVVNIEGIDVEACCGTHCDKTSEVGWIKVINSKRIADGIVRLYFVAGEKTLTKFREEAEILNDLSTLWQIPQFEITKTARRIFRDYKKLNTKFSESQKKILHLQVKALIADSNVVSGLIKSNEDAPTLYFSHMNNYFAELKKNKKSIAFFGSNFLFAFMPDKDTVNPKEIQEYFGIKPVIRSKVGKKKTAIICTLLSITSKEKIKNPQELLNKLGFQLLDF